MNSEEARTVGVAVEGHEFDEAHVHGILERKLCHRRDLIVVHPAHRDRVEFNRRERRLQSGHDSVPDLLEVVAACYELELLRLQRIEGDVDPIQPRLHEPFEVLLQQETVGGHGNVFKPKCLELLHEPHDPPADQRLAAGDADLGDAELQARLGEGQHLLQGENMALVLKLDVLGHTVLAPEVASIRHRDAEVVHLAIETIR